MSRLRQVAFGIVGMLFGGLLLAVVRAGVAVSLSSSPALLAVYYRPLANNRVER
jgi:hypothetical protein